MWQRHLHGSLLVCSVGVDKTTAQVHHLFATPCYHHAGLLSDGGNHHSLQVFFVGILQHLIHILGVDHHSHTLLTLADGKFRTVKSGIFLRHLVQIDKQAVRQFADGYAHAACAKVVAFLNQRRDLFSTKQSLYLSLRRRIALLHFCTAGGQRGGVVRLRSTRSTTATVATGSTAKQYHHIAWVAGQSLHLSAWRCRYHGTYLHALGNIVGVVDFVHQTRRQSYLVAVAAIAVRGGGDNLALRQLARKGLAERLRRVGSTRHTHRLIDVCTSAQRVADAAAQTGCRTAERLYLRRVVVRLVLEIHKPLLLSSVHHHRHHYATSIDFVAHLLVVQQTHLADTLGGKGSDIHQADILVVASHILVLMVCQILLESALYQRAIIPLVKLHIGQLRRKGSVPTVVAPIGVQHPYLGHAGVAALFVVEIALYVLKVGERHCQSQRVVQRLQLIRSHILETVENLHILRLVIVFCQSLGLLLRCHTAVHRVHTVFHQGGFLILGEATAYHVGRCRADNRVLRRIEQTHTLLRTVSPLVELTRQILHREHKVILLMGERLLIHLIHRRFGKHRHLRLLIRLVRDILNIIAHQCAHPFRGYTQICRHLPLQLLRSNGKLRFLLNKNSSNHIF